jgi:hypothetical protein
VLLSAGLCDRNAPITCPQNAVSRLEYRAAHYERTDIFIT